MASAIESGADLDTITDSLARASIETEAGDNNRVGTGAEQQARTDKKYAQSTLTVRAIVSLKEAGGSLAKLERTWQT